MMKVIYGPSVYLVQGPLVHLEPLNKYLTSAGHAELHVNPFETQDPTTHQAIGRMSGELGCEVAARLCYDSFSAKRPGGSQAFFEHIKQVGHGSVLEHANYSFLVTGVSRTLTHELVRHRAGWAYSQASQRYVDESECNMVLPVEILPSSEEFYKWYDSCNLATQTYVQLVEQLNKKFAKGDEAFDKSQFIIGQTSQDRKTARRKRARQAARSVLPGCTETKIFATANVRAIRHFLELRGSAAAEPEIRRLSNHILRLMKVSAPFFFEDYTMDALDDGTFEIRTPYKKV